MTPLFAFSLLAWLFGNITSAAILFLAACAGIKLLFNAASSGHPPSIARPPSIVA